MASEKEGLAWHPRAYYQYRQARFAILAADLTEYLNSDRVRYVVMGTV